MRADRGSAPAARVDDAPVGNWVDLYAPGKLRPFLRLARLDRPIGTWLLLWPCYWSLALAAAVDGPARYPDALLLALFALGAIVMRGAGCTYNDIVDREIDARVPRTAARPIPSGEVKLRDAWIFLALQLVVGHAVLFTFNKFAIAFGLASELLLFTYPFMKRLTHWPQAFLGLAFNWGALLGWAAATGRLAAPAVLLYAGGVFWTLGYDTIYAHQDRESDAAIGIGSSALRLGKATRSWLWVFYGLALLFIGAAGWAAALGGWFFAGLALAGAHLARQILRLDIDDPDSCLSVFRSNRDFGGLVFLSVLAGSILAGP